MIIIIFNVLCLLRNLYFETKKSDSLYLSRKIDFGTPKYEVSLTSTTKNNRYIYICMTMRTALQISIYIYILGSLNYIYIIIIYIIQD